MPRWVALLVLAAGAAGCLGGEGPDGAAGGDSPPAAAPRDCPRTATPAPVGSVRVFARVPEPGRPEGIAIDCRRLYTGSSGSPTLFVFDADTGELLRTVEVRLAPGEAAGGLTAMATDARGRLYVNQLDPPRVVRIDLAGDAPSLREYARFPRDAYPNGMAFDAAGNLYVTDFLHPRIFRVPPGGPAETWLTHPLFQPHARTPFGPLGINGIALAPGGTELFVVDMGHHGPGGAWMSAVYAVPIAERPDPATVRVEHVFDTPTATPEVMRFGASGRRYVSHAGESSIGTWSASWQPGTRYVGPATGPGGPVLFDAPAEVALDPVRRSLMVANHAVFARSLGGLPLAVEQDRWAIVEVGVDDVDAAMVWPDLGDP